MPQPRFLCILACLLTLAPVSGEASQGFDLTGMWQDDVGGRYRIRQVGDTVAWLDERVSVVTNVFMGTIDGNALTGRWLDLPAGRSLGSGSLSLRIESNDRLVKTGSSTSYGGTVITRVGASSPPDPAACRWVFERIGDCTGNDIAVLQGVATPEPAQCVPARANNTIAISWDGVKQKNWGSSTPVTAYKKIGLASCVAGQSPGFIYSCTCGGTVQPSSGGGGGGGGGAGGAGGSGAGGGGDGVCGDPRTIGFMDEWLSRAVPTGGGSYRFDSWARWIGRNDASTVNAVAGSPVDPYTWATRCQYLWSVANGRDSTNLGNMGAYVQGRLAGR